MQPPYESESPLSALSRNKMQIAGLSLLISEGFTAAPCSASFAPQVVAFFFVWYLAATWFLSRSFPLNQKNQLGRYHVPAKSAKRSINFCQIGVKRKTLNVVDVFVPRLFVVVMFHAHNLTFGSAFIHPAEYTKASKPW